MITISLASEPFWTYVDAMTDQLNYVLRLLDGGQLVTQGTDIMSPALLESALTTIGRLEGIGQAIADKAVFLKQTLQLESGEIAAGA